MLPVTTCTHARPKPAQSARVLLVEDEVLLRIDVAQGLDMLGGTVEEAGSFGEARAKLDRFGDSLIAAVIDVGLPDRPGDGLVAEIRSARPTLPILLTSGYDDDALRLRLPADPLVQVLGKPFLLHDLQAALARLGVHLATAEPGAGN